MSADEDEDLPVAGTAVILRDAPQGVEALLLRRPDRGSFAGAWVFPGGMVDPGDRVTGAPEQEDAGRAAVRETAARETAVREAREPCAFCGFSSPSGHSSSLMTGSASGLSVNSSSSDAHPAAMEIRNMTVRKSATVLILNIPITLVLTAYLSLNRPF